MHHRLRLTLMQEVSHLLTEVYAQVGSLASGQGSSHLAETSPEKWIIAVSFISQHSMQLGGMHWSVKRTWAGHQNPIKITQYINKIQCSDAENANVCSWNIKARFYNERPLLVNKAKLCLNIDSKIFLKSILKPKAAQSSLLFFFLDWHLPFPWFSE